MADITITLPDGSKKKVEKGISLLDIAAGIGRSLAEAALVAKVNDKPADLNTSLNEDASIEFITFDSEEGHDVFWHSTSHLLAQAVCSLYPDAKYTIGPAIDNGFYYDFDCSTTFTPDDLVKIEKQMGVLASQDFQVSHKIVSKEEALSVFKEKGNVYKTEIIQELADDEQISIYEQGDFIDLCRGPHLLSTKKIKAVKLTSLAGAYWRGDEKNKMLQRIYGVSFPKKKALDAHLAMIEEAKKRDHRKIGKELDLFSFHEEGPGFPFWHPKGTVLFNLLSDYIRKQNDKRDYQEVMTPIILNDSLWHKSGHWDNFKENMYFTDIDENSFAVKPMNCPGGLLIFKNSMHSYRELPIKNAELGLVHRHELSGVLHGLFRVRSFTQDDAHVFCSPEQVAEQVQEIIDYTIEVYNDFGFEEVGIFLATKPDKAIGSDEDWNMATAALKDALASAGLPYKIKEGEGAFYGPKIEFNIRDCLGRNWQCGTIQVDFSMPTRFDIVYRGNDGKDHTPVMIHRAIFGSLERFIAIVIEHFSGKMPLWLAPVQLTVLTVSEKVEDYASDVVNSLKENGFRVESNYSNESLGNKIRLARNQRVPYILVIGEQEKENKTVSYKTYFGGNSGAVDLDVFIGQLKDAEENKSVRTLLDD